MKLAQEGWPFVAGMALAVLVALWLDPFLAAALGLLLIFTAWFFRDPERTVPSGEGLLVSPADGRVIVASPERVSIFMNVFDVHVCRTPMGGTVEEITHTPGRFLAAYRDAASEHNERMSIVVADGDRRLRFTLVAGLVARRIVCRVRPGQRLARGERVGVIRFGSRVDVHLPEGLQPAVAVGQRVSAGCTPIAKLAAARELEAHGSCAARGSVIVQP